MLVLPLFPLCLSVQVRLSIRGRFAEISLQGWLVMRVRRVHLIDVPVARGALEGFGRSSLQVGEFGLRVKKRVWRRGKTSLSLSAVLYPRAVALAKGCHVDGCIARESQCCAETTNSLLTWLRKGKQYTCVGSTIRSGSQSHWHADNSLANMDGDHNSSHFRHADTRSNGVPAHADASCV